MVWIFETLSCQKSKEATMTISEAKAMFAEMLKTWLLHHNKPTTISTTISSPWKKRIWHWHSRTKGLGNEDREYELCDGTSLSPALFQVSTQRNSFTVPIRNEKSTYSTLRYKSSFFIEKQSTEPGSVLISEIIFNYGRLKVSADINLQKFLFIHSYKDVLFKNTIRKRNLLKR
jgi:hypothetical protein